MIKYIFCIPHYNHAKELTELLNIIRDSYGEYISNHDISFDYEVVICDDNSSESQWNSLLFIKESFDKVKIIKHTENKSCLQARVTCYKSIFFDLIEGSIVGDSYIINVDPDDKLFYDLFDVLEKNTKLYNDKDAIYTDLVVNSPSEYIYKVDRTSIYGDKINDFNHTTTNSIVNTIFKTKLLPKLIEYLDGIKLNLCEDLCINLALRSLIESSVYSMDKFYNYIISGSNSICTDSSQSDTYSSNRESINQIKNIILSLISNCSSP